MVSADPVPVAPLRQQVGGNGADLRMGAQSFDSLQDASGETLCCVGVAGVQILVCQFEVSGGLGSPPDDMLTAHRVPSVAAAARRRDEERSCQKRSPARLAPQHAALAVAPRRPQAPQTDLVTRQRLPSDRVASTRRAGRSAACAERPPVGRTPIPPAVEDQQCSLTLPLRAVISQTISNVSAGRRPVRTAKEGWIK